MDHRREAARVADQSDVVIPEQVQEQVGSQVYEGDRITLLEETRPEIESEHMRGHHYRRIWREGHRRFRGS